MTYASIATAPAPEASRGMPLSEGDVAKELAAADRISGQQTAKRAIEILTAADPLFVVPSASQRKALLVAFVEAGYVIYGKAFDLIRTSEAFNLDDVAEVRKNLDKIWLYEIKSTNKPSVKSDFRGYFFSLSAAELLVAQNLGERYRFAFVNILTRAHVELSLPQVFARARGIYPTWSIQF